MTPRAILSALLLILVTVLPVRAFADDAVVAVAANFTEAMQRLQADFKVRTGHTLTVISGSTGKLYAQITNGAPFDIFLAADRGRPELLEQKGFAVPGSRFTYAIGRLTLWSANPSLIPADGVDALKDGKIQALAMANPDLAPYGLAARQTLTALGLYNRLKDRIVMGENITQTFALIATGNAPLGFVALSSVLSPANKTPGSRWDVPADLYQPIRQDAVLLTRAADNAAAKAFLDYLRSDAAHSLMQQFGYGFE